MNKGISLKMMNIISLMLILGLLVIASAFWWLDWIYLPMAIIMIVIIMLPRFIAFERGAVDNREIVLIALFSAVAAISRIPFAALPSIQPMSAIIILSAYVFGSELGFMVGAISALASNMILGQGPWTPWQMFAWGMMGYIVGLIGKNKKFKPITLAVIGLIFGFLFGWIMNLWFVLGYIKPITLNSILPVYISSLYMDALHGVSNFVIILVLYKPWIRMFKRIETKYDLNT